MTGWELVVDGAYRGFDILGVSYCPRLARIAWTVLMQAQLRSTPPYECLFIKMTIYRRNVLSVPSFFSLGSHERRMDRRKLGLALAALAIIAVAPCIASAEDFGVGVRIGGDHFRDRGEFRDRDDFRGARAEFTTISNQERPRNRGRFLDRSDSSRE